MKKGRHRSLCKVLARAASGNHAHRLRRVSVGDTLFVHVGFDRAMKLGVSPVFPSGSSSQRRHVFGGGRRGSLGSCRCVGFLRFASTCNASCQRMGRGRDRNTQSQNCLCMVQTESGVRIATTRNCTKSIIGAPNDPPRENNFLEPRPLLKTIQLECWWCAAAGGGRDREEVRRWKSEERKWGEERQDMTSQKLGP